jgi:hypothetical protein
VPLVQGFVIFIIGWVCQIAVIFGYPFTPQYLWSVSVITIIFLLLPWTLLAKAFNDLGNAAATPNPGITFGQRFRCRQAAGVLRARPLLCVYVWCVSNSLTAAMMEGGMRAAACKPSSVSPSICLGGPYLRWLCGVRLGLSYLSVCLSVRARCCSYCQDLTDSQALAQPYNPDVYKDYKCVLPIGTTFLILLLQWIVYFILAIYL